MTRSIASHGEAQPCHPKATGKWQRKDTLALLIHKHTNGACRGFEAKDLRNEPKI